MTGALGCIGAWVVKALVERGDEPVVFDQSRDRRRLEAIIEPADLARVTFVQGDVTDGGGRAPRRWRPRARRASSTSPASRCQRAGRTRRVARW